MNLLKNGNFEDGWYHPDGIPELQIPNEWQFDYADKSVQNPYDANPWAEFLRPEVRVLPREQLPPWEQDLFILDGEYCLKPFKGGGSLYFWLTQDVVLEPGEYELTIRVYPDVVMEYDTLDQKVFATDPNAALIRFSPDDYWQSFNPVPSPHPNYRLQTIKHKFSAPGGIYRIRVEFMLPFPLKQNGLFCDAWELVAINEPDPPPVTTSGSRLGTHNIAAASDYGNILDILDDWKEKGGQPAVIKAVNDFGWLPLAQEIFPDVPIVGRVTSLIEGCQGVENPDADLAGMAFNLMKLITDKIKANPELKDIVTWWECCNEPDPPGEFGYAQLARLMMECMEIANEEGLKLAIFSLNAGTPEWSEMVEMCNTGVFEMAKVGGHILSLHEGVFDDQPIDHWYGDLIPGAPVVSGAGALCFRYRYLYYLLEQRDEVVPLVVSEFRTHGANYPKTTEEIVNRYRWYDERARLDDYVLGVALFTLGARDQWFPSHDYGQDYLALVDYAVSIEDLPEPPDPGRGQPRVQYERTYILIPPGGDGGLVGEIAYRFFDRFRPTIGGSADDAGVADLDIRNVVAVQPDAWGDDLQAFFEQYYPGVRYLPASGTNPNQLTGRILASLLKARGVKFVYPTTHQPPVITSEFGFDRGEYTHRGLDLRSSWSAYGDYVLAAHDGKVTHVGHDLTEPWFGYQVKTLTILPDGQEMFIRYAHMVDNSSSVETGQQIQAGQTIGKPDNTGNSTGDHLHIDVKVGNEYADPAILIDWDFDVPEPAVPVALGMHDDGGGDWMADNSITGYLLAHRPVHDRAEPVDFTHLEQAGIKVIMRWCYDYGGVGTFPPAAKEAQWIDAMAQSINESRGVYLHTIGNEFNNPVEWCGGYPSPTEILTPGRVLSLYNRVAAKVQDGILLAPGALDPYNVVAQEFGQPGDPRDWFDAIHNKTDRIDAIVLHAKTQTNNPAECSSSEKFSDEPLMGRYLHLRTYLDQLDWVRGDLRHLPVFITELNPQRVDANTLGWTDNNSAWVKAAIEELERYNATPGQKITSVCFYRYDLSDPWGLANKPDILNEIARQA